MAARQFIPLLLCVISAASAAAPPQLYRLAAYESPTRADPDDLLLLAGYGFASDDTVVYRAIRDTTESLTAPQEIPAASGEESGVAAVVSSADVPYSLTIKMPQTIRPNQSYAIWVHTSHGEWSAAVRINDARPLWISPAVVYASGMPGFLPRELKVVGRNLRPSSGHSTLVRLFGPQHFTGAAASAGPADALDDYVARVSLPARLAPGRYRVMVNRDGLSWVELKDEALEVLPDPPAAAEYSVSEAKFGGCRPDDGIDDTPCILRAIAAAGRGGTVYFGPGSWDLMDGGQPGLVGGEGILVPAGVKLRGAGSARTRVERHAGWSAKGPTAAFTLLGHTQVSGFTFHDLQVYQPTDHAAPYLQLGEDWLRVSSAANASADTAVVSDVTIAQNTFDKPDIAIGVGGLPIYRLFITHNVFGAYGSALELNGDQYNMVYKFRLDDSVIDYNTFEPSSKLDMIGKTGTLASEIGAGYRVDFSGNSADGTSADFQYSSQDATGWRAAFFWNPTGNVENILVSQNTATCTGDKIGDGEAISFDNNTNTFAFTSAPTLVGASSSSVTVGEPLATRQHGREVPIATYYVGHWLQVVSGRGMGQVRKITGYSMDSITHRTTIAVAPAWDVVPAAGSSRISVGREYWQLYVVDNSIDNRTPLCKKSNRSRLAAGSIEIWGQSADSVLAGNRQYDSDGILVQQNYGAPEHACADCAMLGFFNYFLEIRDNIVDGEYDWTNDCSHSGIAVGVAAAPWDASAPPRVGFGVSISHNLVRHADAQGGGAISQLSTWFAGPEPHRWPLSDGMLIHHNSISDVDGARAMAICGNTSPRTGIAFPESAIAWRTVLYANRCNKVSTPLGTGGIDTVKVCPSSVENSCECGPLN